MWPNVFINHKSSKEATGWIVHVVLVACNFYGNMYFISSQNSHFLHFIQVWVCIKLFLVCHGNGANHCVDLSAQKMGTNICLNHQIKVCSTPCFSTLHWDTFSVFQCMFPETNPEVLVWVGAWEFWWDPRENLVEESRLGWTMHHNDSGFVFICPLK